MHSPVWSPVILFAEQESENVWQAPMMSTKWGRPLLTLKIRRGAPLFRGGAYPGIPGTLRVSPSVRSIIVSVGYRYNSPAHGGFSLSDGVATCGMLLCARHAPDDRPGDCAPAIHNQERRQDRRRRRRVSRGLPPARLPLPIRLPPPLCRSLFHDAPLNPCRPPRPPPPRSSRRLFVAVRPGTSRRSARTRRCWPRGAAPTPNSWRAR